MKSLFALIFLLAALSISAQQGIFLNETFYTGFLNVGTKGQIFYWLVESRNNPSTDPLIIWLGGGQSCSSEISVLYETGPYRMSDYQNESITLQPNPYSWNNVANVLYVDHPLGIGYSQAYTYEQNEAAVAQDAGVWLAEFIAAFPQYKGRNFYLAGNSYGAHLISAVYANISTSTDLVAKGILIGNGWIDPANHFISDAKYAFQQELINQAKYDTLSAAFAACVTLIKQNQYSAAITACQASLKQLVGNPPNFNYYNINQTCNGTDCINYDEAFDFLTLPAPELILGVGQVPWSACNSSVNSFFNQDRIQSVSGALGTLLNNGTPILIYNGDLDLIVNWIGGEYAATNITWNGQQQFDAASYVVNGDFGEYKVYENLVFYKVYNAGHLVGMDQPQASLDLLLKFIGGWPSESKSEPEPESESLSAKYEDIIM